MGDIQVCRICLNMDVKMQDLSAYPLESYFASFMIEHKVSLLWMIVWLQIN